MANFCEYKMIVKGKKNARYAFVGAMAALDEKVIEKESGTDDNYQLFFTGSCKWSVDSYCKTEYEGECPVELPEDAIDAREEGEENYWYYTVQEHSRMFDVEVQCCSADVDDPMGDWYEHYKSGNPIDSTCPKELEVLGDMPEICICCGNDTPAAILRRLGGYCQDCYRTEFGEEWLADAMDGYEEDWEE